MDDEKSGGILNRKMNMRRNVFLVLMVLWMAGIFLFSSRTGEESTEDSYFAGTMVGRIFVPGFEEWSADKQQDFAERIDHPVRKTAHAAEYAALGLLAAGVCISGKKKDTSSRINSGIAERIRTVGKNRACTDILLPWAIASLYAATDEIHQLFVPGRSGQISDVILDSAGAMAGILVLAAVRKIRSRHKDKKTERDLISY